jgi:class 3 adenylate cyclase/tetratricopeptide (TPR) repeat protein
MKENPLAYIPMDRRQALAHGQTLPDRAAGAALFADVSGFTPLTEALVRELGRQRGAEELTRYLNLVYDALITELHRYRGSAVAFAGDAITCWFDGDDGARATAAALAMQEAMRRFAAVRTPAGTEISLAMKASVAVGPVRRFLVGDPAIRVIDALAGATLERLAAGEHLAQRGEVVLDAAALRALGGRVALREQRQDERGRAFGVVEAAGGAGLPAEPAPWPPLQAGDIPAAVVRTWLLAPVYALLEAGTAEFLAELRPTVALFVRFAGIEYDDDPAAGSKLHAYVCWMQHVLETYQGTLIDLNIGDKGSYIYINFGAPIAHEDNGARAAAAALELRRPPPELGFIRPVQIGIGQGRMRAGAYGGAEQRTYGVLGDAVNLAARLMAAAQPGQILVGEAAQRFMADDFTWEALPPIRVKGKSEPVAVFALHGIRRHVGIHLPAHGGAMPLIGRQAELALAQEKIDQAQQGRGQLVAFTGSAGIGKSRLLAQVVHYATERGFAVHGGECEAYGVNTGYLVWRSIWLELLGVNPGDDDAVEHLRARLVALDPALEARLPLLGAPLGLAIPDNDLTRGFDPKLRKALLESLLADLLRRRAADGPLLLVLEDCQWLDSLSHDLLETLGREIADLPVVIAYAHRELELQRLKSGRVSALPYHTEIALRELSAAELAELARARLAQFPRAQPAGELPPALIARLTQQAEGNPFYIEELINFIRYNGIDPYDAYALAQLELPATVQTLVMSRLDQLPEGQKTTLKVASVVGRAFRAAWLWGVYPDLGDPAGVRDALLRLSEQELTARDPTEAEIAYFFKQITTHSVVYDSLLHMVRAALHEQIGDFIEANYPDRINGFLDLLAFHYDRSDNVAQRRHYLRLAGESAQAAYANEAAIDYYRRVLPLLEAGEQVDVMLKLGEVLRLVGQWDEAAATYEAALACAVDLGDRRGEARSRHAIGDLLRSRGNYPDAQRYLDEARAIFHELGDRAGVAQVLHLAGTLAALQGEYAAARDNYNASLAIRRAIGDRDGQWKVLNNLAIVAEYQGDLAASAGLHELSLAILRDVGNRSGLSLALGNLGYVLLAQGKAEEARARLGEAAAICREIGDRWTLGNTLTNLGNAVRALGDYGAARRCYAESFQINRVLRDRWAVAYLLEETARLAHLEGRAADALTLLGAAAALRAAINAPLPPRDQAALEELRGLLRAAVGETGADAATAAGAALSADEAIAHALEWLAADG